MHESDQIYHCCRWCKWFDNNYCNHNRTFAVEDRSDIADNLSITSDNGYIQEAIKETVEPDKITEILRAELSETRLSKRKIDEIMQSIAAQINEVWLFDWLLEIDSAVTDTFIKHLDQDNTAAPEVVDPESFWCKYYE